MDLKPEDLAADLPSPEELAQLANGLESPDPLTMQKLVEDLGRTDAPTSSCDAQAAWPPILEEARRRIDTRYAPPPTSHRPVVGPALVLAKRAFRGLFQPFINETLRRQVEFNEALLSSLAAIYEQVQVNARTQALWRREMEARLQVLERQSEKRPSRKKQEV